LSVLRTVYTHRLYARDKTSSGCQNRSSFKCESEDGFYLIQEAKDLDTLQ